MQYRLPQGYGGGSQGDPGQRPFGAVQRAAGPGRGGEAGELLPGTRASGLCDQWAGVICEPTIMDDTGPVCSFVKERDFGLRAVVSELGRAEGLCVKNS